MSDELPTNGLAHGDVSYVSIAVPDTAKAATFYAGLLGWQLEGGHGNDVTPQVGLWDGVREAETGGAGDHGVASAHSAPVRGVVLSFRVDGLASAVAHVRALGGTSTDVLTRPYGLEASCVDDQGQPFFLHQFDDAPTSDDDLANGRSHGDFGYLTLEVASVDLAEAFYGALLGWTFLPGSVEDGRHVEGVRPMCGLWQGDQPGVIPAYRVDDIEAAVEQTRALGGSAGQIEERPYGLSCDFCADDQGTRFHLLQLG